MSEYIKHPSELFCRLMRIHPNNRLFMAGRMSVALEIVTVLRTLEEIPSVMQPDESAVVVSVLQTLLTDTDLMGAYEIYNELSAFRRPVFVPVPSLEDTADADEPLTASSVDVRLESSRSPIPRLRELLEEHRNLDGETIASSAELTDGADETTPSE